MEKPKPILILMSNILKSKQEVFESQNSEKNVMHIFFQRIWYYTPILKAISLFLKNKDQIKCSALLHAVTKYESIFMNNS